MLKDYTPEQFWKLYKNLPEELQKAIFSEETANNIYDVCERNEIEEVSKVAKIVGFILLGVLSPDELKEILEEELKLKTEIAERTFQEINRFILYPVKESIESLYGTEIARVILKKKFPSLEGKPASSKPTPPKKEDVYREPIKEE